MNFRLVIGFLFTASLFAQQRLLTVDDMHKFHDVRDVQISPDGKWVAYTVSSVDIAADKSSTDVWMSSWDGTEQLRLTSSPEAANAPRWSPDGRYLSFLSGRPGKAKGTQIWLLNRMGGEAQQFTDFKNKLSAYEWSPDSKRLLLTMTDRDPSDSDDEKPAAGANAKAPKPIVVDRYKFKQDIQGYLTQKPGRFAQPTAPAASSFCTPMPRPPRRQAGSPLASAVQAAPDGGSYRTAPRDGGAWT